MCQAPLIIVAMIANPTVDPTKLQPPTAVVIGSFDGTAQPTMRLTDVAQRLLEELRVRIAAPVG